jgi:pimeloyl-ACP methyl ester carboxylesterase/class 3 adenylate cyclase
VTERPETQYAWNGDAALAYQVVGSGPVDLVYVPGLYSNVERNWDDPHYGRFLSSLATFTRLIVMDRRGTGMSERLSPRDLPPLESDVADMLAVMDAAGSTRAATLGHSQGGYLSAFFAATYPDRALGAIIFGGFARGTWAPDYPWGLTPDVWDGMIADTRGRFATQELQEEEFVQYAPSLADDEPARRWWTSYWRSCVTPSGAAALMRLTADTDVRGVLPSIHVPTLVLQRSDDRIVQAGEARDMANRIPGAKYVELAGQDHCPWFGDQHAVLIEIDRFLSSVADEEADLDRVLATVMFTDIIGSTEKAASLGDRQWAKLVERHHATVRSLIARYRGTEVDTAGDGFYATFDGPAQAVKCARAIIEAVQPLGIQVRAGVHTGECERIDNKLGGLAVVIGARIGAAAAPSEVLTSQTVKDLTAGSGIVFEDRGEHALKGVPDRWRLYQVTS